MYPQKRFTKSFLKFYFIIAVELLFFPILIIWNCILNGLSILVNLKVETKQLRFRSPVIDESINICIHEWGGYDLERSKEIAGKRFTCGLKYQLMRIDNYKGVFKLNPTITISDYPLYKHKTAVASYNVIPVSNKGMDFSGYSTFINQLPETNEYLLLMNSSISAIPIDFIDDYILYFKLHKDVGMLGISYNTTYNQTLIRNVFAPHIQSFFILTTTDVMRRVIKLNNGCFPGADETYKLSIIRNGEVRLSQLVQRLGYKIAVIMDDGTAYQFYRNSWLDNGYGRWKKPKGDCRYFFKNVNAINLLNREYV